MKKLIVLGIVVVCIGLTYQYPHSMVSPGELVKGHQKINGKCSACHNPFSGISNDKCISCHKLAEIGKDSLQLTDNRATTAKILFHEHLVNQKCTSCHSDHKGTNPGISLSRFDHGILSLTQLNNCNSCHVQPTDDLHKPLTTACNNCHNTRGWRSSVLFDHDMILGEVKNNCSTCHKNPGDSFHQSIKETCDKCHNTHQWKPSTFDHSAYFHLDRDHNGACNTCHINNDFKTFTCYGCHEHTENKIREEHEEHGIYNFTNCIACHKNADKHDIRINGKSGQELDQKELNNVKEYINSNKKDNKKEHDDD